MAKSLVNTNAKFGTMPVFLTALSTILGAILFLRLGWAVGHVGFFGVLGIIFLGLNAARYYNGIKMSGFTTFLGLLSLLTGITQLLGFAALDGAFFLIILGAYLILKPWFDKHQLFGKVA